VCPLTFIEFVPDFYKGYPCFFISIARIGLVTTIARDVAGHLGCFINLKVPISSKFFARDFCTKFWRQNKSFPLLIVCVCVFTAKRKLSKAALKCFFWNWLKDSVNAITFVAIGTSVPDIFASKVSAVQVSISPMFYAQILCS